APRGGRRRPASDPAPDGPPLARHGVARLPPPGSGPGGCGAGRRGDGRVGGADALARGAAAVPRGEPRSLRLDRARDHGGGRRLGAQPGRAHGGAPGRVRSVPARAAPRAPPRAPRPRPPARDLLRAVDRPAPSGLRPRPPGAARLPADRAARGIPPDRERAGRAGSPRRPGPARPAPAGRGRRGRGGARAPHGVLPGGAAGRRAVPRRDGALPRAGGGGAPRLVPLPALAPHGRGAPRAPGGGHDVRGRGPARVPAVEHGPRDGARQSAVVPLVPARHVLPPGVRGLPSPARGGGAGVPPVARADHDGRHRRPPGAAPRRDATAGLAGGALGSGAPGAARAGGPAASVRALALRAPARAGRPRLCRVPPGAGDRAQPAAVAPAAMGRRWLRPPLDGPDLGILAAGAAALALFIHAERRIAGHWGLPLDDSWIHLRLAANLAAGRGFGINPGEPLAASTAPLWTVALAGLLVLGVPGLAAAT